VKQSTTIILGPQASPPARAQHNQEHLPESLDEMSWFFSTRAGGDACGPRTMASSSIRDARVRSSSRLPQHGARAEPGASFISNAYRM